MNNLPELIANSTLFSRLNENQRAEVVSRARRRSFQKGELIALYGDIWAHFLIVGGGEITAVKESSEGRRLVVGTFGPGEFFWGLAFFNDGTPMPVTLEANRASHVYLWNREGLQPILLENGQFLWELCRQMVSRMQQASVIVEGLAFQSVAERVARFMLGQFSDAATPAIMRDLTLDEMAAMVGTTREMVCRVLYHFADKKLIQITRTEFVLDNQEGLAEIAES